MKDILKRYGFVESSIPNQFNYYNAHKAILWVTSETVTICSYTPNSGRLLDSTTIEGVDKLEKHFQKIIGYQDESNHTTNTV